MLEATVGMGLAGVDQLGLLGDLYAEQLLAPEASATYQKLFALAPDMGEQKLLRYAHALVATGKTADAERLLDSLKTAKLTPDGAVSVLLLKAEMLEANSSGRRREPFLRRY